MRFYEAVIMMQKGERVRSKEWYKEQYITIDKEGITVDQGGQGYVFRRKDYISDWEVYQSYYGLWLVDDEHYSNQLYLIIHQLDGRLELINPIGWVQVEANIPPKDLDKVMKSRGLKIAHQEDVSSRLSKEWGE